MIEFVVKLYNVCGYELIFFCFILFFVNFLDWCFLFLRREVFNRINFKV